MSPQPPTPAGTMALGPSLQSLQGLATGNRFETEPQTGYGAPTSLWLVQLTLGWQNWLGLGQGLGAAGVVALQLFSPLPHLPSERSGPSCFGGRREEGQADQGGLREGSRSQACSRAMGPAPASWRPGLLLTCSYLYRRQ